MECNKEEAIRAKGIAEKKMKDNDFIGSRRIAIKAQRLDPNLENINQMICVCDVHCSAAIQNLGKEKNWYEILKVKHYADDVAIKKQYRKLALLLHPDKNKFAGAESAFILIGEAQKVLLDREKRSSFDARYTSFCHNIASPNLRPYQEKKNLYNPRPPSDQKKSCYVKKKQRNRKGNGKEILCAVGLFVAVSVGISVVFVAIRVRKQ